MWGQVMAVSTSTPTPHTPDEPHFTVKHLVLSASIVSWSLNLPWSLDLGPWSFRVAVAATRSA